MTTLTQAAPSLVLDTRRHLGQVLMLTSSGVLDGGHFVIAYRNRETDPWRQYSAGVLAQDAHLEHGIIVSAIFYAITIDGAGATADAAVVHSYYREVQQGGLPHP